MDKAYQLILLILNVVFGLVQYILKKGELAKEKASEEITSIRAKRFTQSNLRVDMANCDGADNPDCSADGLHDKPDNKEVGADPGSNPKTPTTV